jgi:hypothetical protein
MRVRILRMVIFRSNFGETWCSQNPLLVEQLTAALEEFKLVEEVLVDA